MLRLPLSCVAAVLTLVLLPCCGIRLPIALAEPSPAACATTRSVAPSRTAGRAPHVLVWMISNNFHTGMVFPYDWLEESGFVAPAGFGKPRYVVMSWGNKDAYSPAGVDTTWKLLRVVFTPTPSVMELIPINWDVTEVCPQQQIWRKLVPRDRGPVLAQFLNDCSVRNAAGRPQVVCPSSWGQGVQLEGRHSYFIPRVCNIWTAQTHECLGCNVNPWFALAPQSLAWQVVGPPNGFELIWPGGGKPTSPVHP